MVPDNYKIVNILNKTATAAGTELSGYVDTKGYDYLVLNAINICTVAASPLTGLRVREDDTVPTAFTDMTAIVKFTGAAATSTSAGFVLPGNNSVVDNIHQFNIDLRGRKRYIGLDMVPTTSGWCSCAALLFRGCNGKNHPVNTSADATTVASQLRLVVNG